MKNKTTKSNQLLILVAAAILLGCGAARADYRSTVLGDGPVSYWPLNETKGPVIHDIVGTNNGTMFVGTVYPTTQTTNDGSAFGMGGPGLLNTVPSDSAIYFNDASNAQIEVPYNPQLDPAQWSIEAWFNIPSYPIGDVNAAYQVPLGLADNNLAAPPAAGSGQGGWSYLILGNNFAPSDGVLAGWAAHQGGTGWNFLDPSQNYQGNWVYGVMTYDGTTLKLYEQGNLLLSGASAYQTVAAEGALNPLTMGSWVGQGNEFNDWYQGGMEQVAFYNYPLSASQILNHYAVAQQPSYSSTVAGDLPTAYWPLHETNGPIVHDVVGTNNGTMFVGTVFPTTQTTNDGSAFGLGAPGVLFGVTGDTSINFNDASNAQIEVPYNAQLDPAQWSVEAWFNIPSYPIGDVNAAYQVPLGFADNNLAAPPAPGSGQGGWSYLLLGNNFAPSDGVLAGWAAHSGGVGWNFLDPAPNYEGNWVHGVMTYDGTTLKLYEQGNLLLSGASAYQTVAAEGALNPLTIGSWVGQGNEFNDWYLGGMEQVAVYNYPLSASQVLNHYDFGKFGPVIPASIGTQPQGATNYAGYNPTLTVSAGGTAPLAFQWYQNGNAVAGATADALTLADAQPSQSGSYTVTVSNSLSVVTSIVASVTILPLPANSYQASVISEFPDAYYPMQETSGTNCNDVIQTGNNSGYYLGGFTLAQPGPSSYVGKSVAFDGASGGAWIPNNFAMIFNGALTFEAWVQVNDTNDDQVILQCGPGPIAAGNPSGAANALGISSDNTLTGQAQGNGCYYIGRWVETGNSGTPVLAAPIPASDLGKWVHLVGVADGTAWRLYDNGVEIGETNDTVGGCTPFGGWDIAAINGYGFGGPPITETEFPDPFGGLYFGSICNVAIYQYALTPGMISQHYQIGTAGHGVNSTPTTLSLLPTGGSTGGSGATSLEASWPYGYLQEAASVTGPWTYVPNATSPATIPVSGSTAAKFFRVVITAPGTPGT